MRNHAALNKRSAHILTKLEAVTSLYRSPKGTIRKRSWSEFTLT